MEPTLNGLSMAWALYVKELLIELTMRCDDPVHKDQLEEINYFIDKNNKNEIRIW